jgi:hypothetical protein
MSNDAKKTSELSIVTGLSATDRIVVLTNPANATSKATQTITVANFYGNSKFTNTATVANSTAAGIVKVGNNLSINASGHISGNTKYVYGSNDFYITANTSDLVFNTGSNGANGGFVWTYANTQLLKLERDGHLVVNSLRSRHTYGNGDLVVGSGPNTNYLWTFGNTGNLTLPANGDIKYANGHSALKVTGPYANDSAAASGNVAINSLYYDASGNVKIRLT